MIREAFRRNINARPDFERTPERFEGKRRIPYELCPLWPTMEIRKRGGGAKTKAKEEIKTKGGRLSYDTTHGGILPKAGLNIASTSYQNFKEPFYGTSSDSRSNPF